MGFSYGFTFAVLYLGFAVTFGFGGGFQFLQDSSSILYADLVNPIHCLHCCGIQHSCRWSNQSLSAKTSIVLSCPTDVFSFLIDRQSLIDASSDIGDKPVSISVVNS